MADDFDRSFRLILLVQVVFMLGMLGVAGFAVWVLARWLGVLGLYDLVFGLLALAVFDFLLED